MTEFRNPYHFIPVKDAEEEPEPEQQWRTDATEFRSQGPTEGDAHDRYSPSAGADARWSGRIICRLTAQTPLVIGAEQGRTGGSDDYAYVKPYRWKGRPAIPATSLKGLISSLAEAASGSSLRVLHDRKPLSYRQPMNRALHALGLIVDGEEPGSLAIQPLTLPLLQRDHSDKIRLADRARPWEKVYEEYANLKVYIGNYKQFLDERDDEFRERFKREPSKDEKSKIGDISAEEFARSLPIAIPQSDPICGYHHFYYMRVSEGEGLTSLCAKIGSRQIVPGERGGRIFAQVPSDGPNGEILTAQDYKKRDSPAGFVRGIIRILGAHDRQIPDNKKHELFIPYPAEIEQRTRTLPLPKHVTDKFYGLALQRAEENDDNREKVSGEGVVPPKPARQRLPYLPFDSDENESASWNLPENGAVVPRLRKGQIVYFDIAKGAIPRVTAISFSAIWRDCATQGEERLVGVHDFFSEIDKELIPYHDGRESLTPAERLFGFVTAARKPETKNAAYAGRVHFSIATLETDPGNDSVLLATETDGCDQPDASGIPHTRLKVLGSPKLPSPALYFTRAANRDMGKMPLQQGDRPQGRKAYLHHRIDGTPEPQPWKTKLPKGSADEQKQRKLKNAVRPIKPGTAFIFHIDFDNLTEREIDLLAFALRPTELFRHKLGMGKSIGLGTVKIDPVALLLLDRTARYSGDIFSSVRWHRKSVSAVTPVPAKYDPDMRAAGDGATDSLEARAASYKAWASEPSRWREAIHALTLIGESNHDENPYNDDLPVHTPLMSEQSRSAPKSEQDTFEWHAMNTRVGLEPHKYIDAPQVLRPIGDKDKIPPLLKLTGRKRR